MTPDPSSPPSVHHLALQVRDLPRVEAFYRDLLGLRVLRRWPWADGRPGERAVWLALGDGDPPAAFLALEAVDPSSPPIDLDGHAGWFLVALRIPAATRGAWAQRLERAGHPVYRTSPFTLYVRDPEGNRIGLSHHPDPAPDADHHL